jgi:hypothetical protein
VVSIIIIIIIIYFAQTINPPNSGSYLLSDDRQLRLGAKSALQPSGELHGEAVRGHGLLCLPKNSRHRRPQR